MKKNKLQNCPICGNALTISKLKCTECDMEYSGNFQMHAFSDLSDSEFEFIKTFLKNEGNISKLQHEIGQSYASIKNTLKKINGKLGTVPEKQVNIDMSMLSTKAQTGIIKVIQDKFLECGGKSQMTMLRNGPLEIWISPSGEGVANSGYKGFICEWHILESIVKKANELGGMMYKGDSAAQNGAKIGSPELPLNTIDAYISLEFYGANQGESTLRRSTYYAAILAWAGIVENHRSNGKGGYIIVKPEYRE